MAENPIPFGAPPEYFKEARRIIKLGETQDRLFRIAEKIKNSAGPGHAVKRDMTRDRVRVQVFTASDTAKAAEASDKKLTKAFAAARTTPRRSL
jgi:hypothetical protein